MTANTTKTMLAAYEEIAPPTPFFTGMFQAPPMNFYTSEKVEFDIWKASESIAIAQKSADTGYRFVSLDKYTNKEFVPPVLKEAFNINAFSTIYRQLDQNPYVPPDYRASAQAAILRGSRALSDRFTRSIELQAAQVLQTGTATLTDTDGLTVFSINYSPISAQFPTASTAWDQAGADPIGDLIALAGIIRTNGKRRVTRSIWGQSALQAAMDNAKFLARLDNRRLDGGMIVTPRPSDAGGIYQGDLRLGDTMVEIWTYDGQYDLPTTGASTKFMDKGKVILMDPTARLDATFGAIPRVVPPDPRLASLVPGRISSSNMIQDLNFNAWTDAPGENVKIGIATRPLMIPTAINTFGCITSGV